MNSLLCCIAVYAISLYYACATLLPSPTENEEDLEPKCFWSGFRKLHCQVKLLEDNFSTWITDVSWPVKSNSTSAVMSSGLASSSMIASSSSLVTPYSSSHRYKDATRATSLTVECLPFLLESSISESTFKSLDELTVLKIVNCKLTSVPRGSLVNLSQLRELKVTSMNSEWTSLSLEVQTNSLPPSLEKINFSHNSIWSLPRTTFCGFKNLLQLDLSHNRLQNVEELGLGKRQMKDENPATGETKRGNKAIITENQISETINILSDISKKGFSDIGAFVGDHNKFKDFIEYDIAASASDIQNISILNLHEALNLELDLSCGKSLHSLILDNNAFVRLPSRSFIDLAELQFLFLSNNDIRVVSDRAFEGLDSLQALDLSNNHIMTLYNRTFKDCVRMEKLYLRNNSITGFSVDIFSTTNGLQILDISRNKLTLQEGYDNLFDGLRRLVILNLSNNLITYILVPLFRDMSSLQRLDLSYNLLTAIDKEVFSTMPNLYELNLSHNNIHSLSSSSFAGLLGLSILNLSNNSLLELQSLIVEQSSNLKQIILSNNKFEAIPIALQNLSFLNYLDVSRNNILMIEPYNFDRLSNLHVLNLSLNIISNITTESFNGMKSLHILDMSSNNIGNIAEGSLDSIPGLKKLDLARNKIHSINGLFAGMEYLDTLDLSENSISMFDYAFLPRQLLNLILKKNKIKQLGNYFKVHSVLALEEIDASFNNIQIIGEVSLPNTVKRVMLEQNKIQEVKPGTFREKLNIELINLRMNQISKLNPKSVSPEWVSRHQDPALLYLGGNPLQCDCEMEWLYGAAVPFNQSNENHETNYRLPIIGDVSDVVCTLPHSIGNVTTYSKIIHTSTEDYLCPYAAHCFTLCHCCDFIACDCQMKCPASCFCFHDDTWSVNLVDCSRGNLKRLPDKVPMDATVVFLDGNNLQVLHAHHFIGRHSIQKLYLNNSNIQTLQNRTFHGLSSLQYLFLQGNMIVQLNGFEFSGLNHLKELHLQNNRISFLHNDTFVGLKTLEFLRIDNNFIVDFPVWLLSRNLHLKRVFLSNNPWDCSCEFTKELSRWVSATHHLVYRPEDIFCMLDNSGKVWPGISEPDFVCAEGRKRVSHYQFGPDELPFLAGGVCGGVALITALVIMSMIFARRKTIKAQKLGLSTSTSCCQEEDGKVFDAYITYSVCDTSFVRDILASKLENSSPNYKLCLHHRDYNENSRMSDFIAQSTCFSRRIVIVISNSFIDNEWEDSLFRRSTIDCLSKRDSNLIVINFDCIQDSNLQQDLMSLIRRADRVRWGDKYFWKKLGELLPTKSVYSGFSLYISDPLYKSPVPILSPARVMDMPSSSSVLTNTTVLTTPSDAGRSSFLSEIPATYKAPPPPRPCNPESCDYMYMSSRDCKQLPCHCHEMTQSVYSSVAGDTTSVHTYNSLDILSRQITDCQSSPECHHYSRVNAPASPVLNNTHKKRKYFSPLESSGSYDNVISPTDVDILGTPHRSYLQRPFRGKFRLSEVGEDDFTSSSTSSSEKLDALNDELDISSRARKNLPGFPSDECFV